MAKKTGYLGNAALKSAGERIEYTAEQILEWKRCSEDPVYFMRKFYKIVHVDRGIIPFDPFAYQIRITETVVGNRFVICKLPRQSGKTTVIAAVLLWYVLFTEVFKIGILAHKEKQAREILARIKMAYQLLPKWLQQGIVDGGWNKGSILLENGSEITAHATSADAIRGGSFNIVYLDEFAHVENNLQEEFFASVFPTISSGQTTKVLITSTPKGMNQFYRIWTDAVNKKNSYVPVDIHWSETPGRDEAWKEETIKNTSARQFEQEFECVGGSTNVTIKDKKTGQIEEITVSNLLNRLTVISSENNSEQKVVHI